MTMEHDLGDTGQQTRSEHDIPDDERGGLELTESPRRIGRFSVLRRVGRGGMGDVYSALDARLGRQVAVKLLKKQPRDQKGRRSRMLREAKAMARVTHPHVVQVYEIGDFNGRVFITMELVEGHTLEHWQKIRVRTHQEVLDAYRQAGEGLAAAHRASVLHRDFKPGNVLIDERGWVRVTDFGLAAWISAASSYVTAEQGIDGTFEGSDDAEPRLTRAGARLGTPAFMSPEQHLGEALDARSDQFSFCVALYEALTGSHPFGGSTRDEVRSAILLGNVRETNHARPLPAWLRPVLLRGLEREPENRWPTMDALLEALKPRRRSWKGVAAAMAVMSAVGVYGAVMVADTSDACRGTDDALARVWNDQSQTKAEAGLVRTGLPSSPRIWEGLRPALEAYTEQWSQTRVRVCEATRVHEEQSETLMDQRMECLDLRLGAVRELMAAFGEADSETALRASRAVARLPAIGPCERVGADVVAKPRADGPKAAALRLELVAARTLLTVGKFSAAEGRAEAIRLDAVSLPAPSIAVEAQLVRGLAERRLGRTLDAVATLYDASWSALGKGLDEIALEATLVHLETVGVALVDRDASEAGIVAAQALLERLGAPPERRIAMLRVTAAVLARLGRYEEARQRAEQATKLIRTLRGAHDVDYPSVRRVEGDVALFSGRLEDAKTIYEELALERGGHFASDRLGAAAAFNNLAIAHAQRGEIDLAERYFDQVYRVRLEILGNEHLLVADALLNLAGIADARGELERTLDLSGQARDIYATRLGTSNAKTNAAELGRAMALERLGRIEEAETIYRRGLDTQRAEMGPDHPDLVLWLRALGRLLMDRPEGAKEAIGLLETGLELARARAREGGQARGEDKDIEFLEKSLAEARSRLAGTSPFPEAEPEAEPPADSGSQ